MLSVSLQAISESQKGATDVMRRLRPSSWSAECYLKTFVYFPVETQQALISLKRLCLHLIASQAQNGCVEGERKRVDVDSLPPPRIRTPMLQQFDGSFLLKVEESNDSIREQSLIEEHPLIKERNRRAISMSALSGAAHNRNPP